LIAVFKNCYKRVDWCLNPPHASEVWIDEYLEKRGWTGYSMWIDPLKSTDFLPDDYDPCEDNQNTVKCWMIYYQVKHMEDAVVNWCYEHCTGRWDRFLKYGVEFENKEDALYFKLAWCV